MDPTTIPEAFEQTVSRHGGRVALMHAVSGEYVSLTYTEMAEAVHRFARGLLHLGIEPDDRVGLVSENRPEWAIADIAMLSIGAVNVPVFPTLPASQLEFPFRDSAARVVLVSDAAQLAKLLQIWDRLPALEHIVVFDGAAEPAQPGVVRFADVAAPAEVEPELERLRLERMARLSADGLATITYTSGTTGEPKGVMLTHGNLVFDCLASLRFMPMHPEDRFLSFLPLNHVFERLAGHYMPLFSGSTIAYAESIVKLTRNMLQVRPTVITAVPRVYETVATRVEREAERTPGPRGRVARWALEVARAWSRRVNARKRPGLLLGLARALADRLVYGRIRAIFGGEVRLLVAGGAPLAPERGYLFHGVGITMIEGYGLTETSPVITCNPGYARLKFGTVGIPLPGIEVRIAEDGEVLTRGPHVMAGYWNLPEATVEVIDAEGWFHTGDIGRLDDEGYLAITDRKKDLLVLANGKKVAPAPIEGRLKSSALISDVLLVGDSQDHVSALVVPDFAALREALPDAGPDLADGAVAGLAESRKAIDREIRRLSEGLADFEKVRRFRVLDHEFSVDSGELTPTLKVRRRVVMARYAEEIAAMAN